MADRRAPPRVYAPWISLGNILTILAGVGAIALFLVTVGSWKGTIDASLSNQHEMIAATRGDLTALGGKVDRVAEAVAGIDGKLSSLSPVKKASAE